MTDKVIPSAGGSSNGYIVAQLIRYGASTDGWIQESASALLADNDSDLDQTAVPLNAFTASHSATSLDVTIDTGEGFVGGAWVARDVTTTVTLAASTTGQTVYLGWDYNATETVRIGTSGAFESEDPRIPIWTFDTDGSGVTAATDERTIGPASDLGVVSTDAGSSFARFLMEAVSGTPVGSEGNSTNEVWRAPGSSSDLLMSVNADGKMNLAWNAYFDGTDWRYITTSEPAYRLTFGPSDVTLHAAGGTTTADSVVSFNSLSLGTGGDVSAGASNLWDATNTEVPQANLGGPAASLSAYPVPAGDIDDGAGSGLDSDLVDGYHASDLQGGQWTTIESYSTTDATTSLGYDSGVLTTTYDLYRIEVTWVNHDSSAAYLSCRVNNEATSNYDGLYLDDTSEVYHGHDTTEWQNIGKVAANQIGQASMQLRGGSPPGADAGTVSYPTISVQNGGTPTMPHLISGELTVEYATVDQLAVDSLGPATGQLKVLGMSI